MFRTNVFGSLSVTRGVLPQMRKQRSGHIINMSSIGGYQSYIGWGVYCATKFAVEGITESLALAFAVGDFATAGPARFSANRLPRWDIGDHLRPLRSPTTLRPSAPCGKRWPPPITGSPTIDRNWRPHCSSSLALRSRRCACRSARTPSRPSKEKHFRRAGTRRMARSRDVHGLLIPINVTPLFS